MSSYSCSRCETISAYWRGSELFRNVEEFFLRQGTAGDPAPRPQQSPHRGHDTTSAATKNQAIHQADPTSNNDSRVPRRGLSSTDPSPSGFPGLPHQSATQHDMERDVAGPQAHSGYPSDNDPELLAMEFAQEFQLEYAGDRTMNDYPQAPRDDPSDDTARSPPSVHQGIPQRGVQSAEESSPNSIPSTVFQNTLPISFSHLVPDTPQGGTAASVTQHQDTFLAANDRLVPANAQVPVSPTDARRPISACGWDDGGGPCGINLYKGGIVRHMKSHVKSRLSSESPVKCQWKGCGNTLRRDTIFRHISEKHCRIRRSKSRRRRAVPINCGRLP